MGDWQKEESRLVGGFGSARETTEIHDITSSRLAEAALRKSEERFTTYFAHAAVGLAINDLQGRFLKVNPAYCSITGYTQAELLALDFQTITYPDDLPKTMEQLRALLADEIPACVREERLVRKDGSIVWVQNSVSLNRDSEGRPISLVKFSQDIGERKRVEQAFREAERRYHDILENAGEGIFQTSPDGRFITANPALARMLGFDSPEDLLRERTYLASQHYVDPQRREAFKRLLEENDVVRGFEYQGHSKDGRKIWLSDSVRAVRDQSGVLLYYEGIVEDITEHKRAEKALLASERRYRDIFTLAPVGIYQSLRDGTLLTANKALAEMLAYDSVEEFLEVNLHQVYLDGERDRLIREYQNRGYTGDLKIRWKRKHGSPIWVQLTAHAINGVDGAVEYFEGFVRDVTEHKQAEEALRESEERYRELFENAKDTTYVHDLDGRYTSVNRVAEKLTGYTRGEILGKNFTDFVAPEGLKYVRENLRKKLAEEGETTYEVNIISKDGRRVPVEVSSRLIFENGVAVGVQGTARDIAERKLAEEATRTYSRRLVEAQEAERQAIARELHDNIGQVLTAVKINLHSLQSSRETGLPRIAESIAIVDEALLQVRDLSFELRPSLLDDLGLTAALRWYVDRYSRRTGIIAEVASNLETHERLRREIETACFRIAQEALTNIARHARAKRVSVQLNLSHKELLLVVRDDGIGFDARGLLEHGFSLSAMGLRGMEERALAVGGDLKIGSAPTRGTEIRASFPLSIER